MSGSGILSFDEFLVQYVRNVWTKVEFRGRMVKVVVTEAKKVKRG